MRSALLLLFLVMSYNLILWVITAYGLSPIPLFPEDPYHITLVLAYNSVLYVSWLFGERTRTVQWIGYLFFFQILALSLFFKDLRIIVKDLSPVILTFALVVLFESPTEKRIKEVEREREELLQELDRIKVEREKVEAHLKMLKVEIERIREEKKKEGLTKEVNEELERKMRKLQREVEEYKEKESRLLEANRKLFHLLDILRTERETNVGKGEVTSLRKERKKLIRELLQLQELVDIYADENEKLKEENEKLRKDIEKITLELEKTRMEKTNSADRKEILKDVLQDLFQLSFSDRSVEELLKLPAQKKRVFLKELLRFSQRGNKVNIQPLTTLPNVYKLRFSGGRIYLTRKNGSWKVIGLLDSEEDKDKERYIRNVLSKIV